MEANEWACARTTWTRFNKFICCKYLPKMNVHNKMIKLFYGIFYKLWRMTEWTSMTKSQAKPRKANTKSEPIQSFESIKWVFNRHCGALKYKTIFMAQKFPSKLNWMLSFEGEKWEMINARWNEWQSKCATLYLIRFKNPSNCDRNDGHQTNVLVLESVNIVSLNSDSVGINARWMSLRSLNIVINLAIDLKQTHCIKA